MLRELTIRELTDTEMERVGGGEVDEIVVTGTRRTRTPYVPYNPFGGSSSQYHESYQPTRTGGGGGTSTPAPAPEPEPNDDRCIPPPDGYGSHAEYTNMLNSYSRNGGAAGDGNSGASMAALFKDLWNIRHGCEY